MPATGQLMGNQEGQLQATEKPAESSNMQRNAVPISHCITGGGGGSHSIDNQTVQTAARAGCLIPPPAAHRDPLHCKDTSKLRRMAHLLIFKDESSGSI